MIAKWIHKLLSQKSAPLRQDDLSALAPAGRFYAIGDIHGRLDLLQTLLAALDDTAPLVFLGDYIDRGIYSAQVLRHLYHLGATAHNRAICLKGNHEEMMLNFLDMPQKMHRIWMQNGGMQTLTSFGLSTHEARAPEVVADDLRHAIGEPLLTWLRGLPVIWTTGNVTAVHAALDPSQPSEAQSDRTCLWGHPGFPANPRKDGQWVVHGHTIMDEPHIRGGVISIDTGAFATNELTAAEISPGHIQFISTSRKGILRSTVRN